MQDDLWDFNATESELWFNLRCETKADVYLNANSSLLQYIYSLHFPSYSLTQFRQQWSTADPGSYELFSSESDQVYSDSVWSSFQNREEESSQDEEEQEREEQAIALLMERRSEGNSDVTKSQAELASHFAIFSSPLNSTVTQALG